MSRYDKEKLIGSGTFGAVWLVKSKLSRHAYVLKEIKIEALNEEEQKQAYTEASALSKCKHRNVIRYKETIMAENKYLQIIMEYAEGGDLYSAIINQKGIPFTDHRILTWFIQICLALQYIHFKNILHRDLKSPNIFLTRSKTIKIGDFGIARMLKGPGDLAETAIGTPYYLSPEIFQRKPYNYKSDMWALGCVLFEMTALEHAFKAKDFFHLTALVLRGERRPLPENCNPVIEMLIDSLLLSDPEERPSTDEILKYYELQPYLSEYMANQSPRENFLTLLTGKLDKEKRRSSLDTFKVDSKNPTKRRNSINASPLILKRITTPSKNVVKPRPCFNNGFIKRYKKSSNKPVKEYDVSCRIKNKTYSIRMGKMEPEISLSCDTYALPSEPESKSPRLTKSDDSMSGANGYDFTSPERSISNVFRRSFSTGSYCEETTRLAVDKRNTKSETYYDAILKENDHKDATIETEGNIFIDSENSACSISTQRYYSGTIEKAKIKAKDKINSSNTENGTTKENKCPKDETNNDSALNTVSYRSDSSHLVTESSNSRKESDSLFSAGSFNGTKDRNSKPEQNFSFNNCQKAEGGPPSKDLSEADDDVFSNSPNGCEKHPQAGKSPDSPIHSHCSHAQCHQCMLDMLWKNRIRCRVGKTIDKDEYQRLKSRLLRVFKVNLFEKVRNSLLCDWDESEDATFKSKFKGIVKTLNYEQVQSLPLMMQLIQLDLLTKNQRSK